MVKSEGAADFERRLPDSLPLSTFLIQELQSQADLATVDGRARLAELSRPLLNRIPKGIYRELLVGELAETVGMPAERLARLVFEPDRGRGRGRAAPTGVPVNLGRSPLVRRALELILQCPGVAATVAAPAGLEAVEKKGVPLLVRLLEECRSHPNITTAGLLERWRDKPEGVHLGRLAGNEVLIPDQAVATELTDSLNKLVQEAGPEQRTEILLARAREQGLDQSEKQELKALLAQRAKDT